MYVKHKAEQSFYKVWFSCLIIISQALGQKPSDLLVFMFV